MTTTTKLKIGVNLLERSTIYTSNCITQLGFRIENGRGLQGYMVQNQEWIERGIQTWLGEQKLLSAHYEIYDPATDKAYERCQIDLTYITDAREEVVKPPIEELDRLLKKLPKLAPGAKLRIVVFKAPGASEVEGWYPTTLKPFDGGESEDFTVGDTDHGFGHIWSKIVYKVAKKQYETQAIDLSGPAIAGR
jgi:hypothetical protein